jgi:hypothetical protein
MAEWALRSIVLIGNEVAAPAPGRRFVMNCIPQTPGRILRSRSRLHHAI